MIKWLRRIGLVVVVAIAVVVVLRVGFGLHVYMDGDFGLHLAFGKPSAHYDALEAQRAAQRAAPPAAAPAAAAAAPAAAAADPARRRRSPALRRPHLQHGAAPQPARSRRRRRPPSLDRGPTFAARPATASTASAPSPRPGRPAGRACSGSSRSAWATRRS